MSDPMCFEHIISEPSLGWHIPFALASNLLTLANPTTMQSFTSQSDIWQPSYNAGIKVAYLIVMNCRVQVSEYYTILFLLLQINKYVFRLPMNVSKPIQINLPISHAGAFAYWVKYDNETSDHHITGRQDYFNIGPLLCIN